MTIFFPTFSVAQTTYYYRLTKKIQDGIEYTNTAGGQFITFEGDICYDSDKWGIKVGNGQLCLDKQHSTNSKTYIGNSYFGNTVYRFKSDLSLLNIVVTKNLLYVYKRDNPPSDQITCSLIKSKQSNPQSQVSGGYVGGYYPPINGGSYNTGNSNSSTQSVNSQSSSSSTTKNQPTRHTCSRCNGKGRIAIETHPPMFGQEDYKERCSECGGYFLHSWGHTHTSCPQCHGKGYFTTD